MFATKWQDRIPDMTRLQEAVPGGWIDNRGGVSDQKIPSPGGLLDDLTGHIGSA